MYDITSMMNYTVYYVTEIQSSNVKPVFLNYAGKKGVGKQRVEVDNL